MLKIGKLYKYDSEISFSYVTERTPSVQGWLKKGDVILMVSTHTGHDTNMTFLLNNTICLTYYDNSQYLFKELDYE